jgi:hypothetical protein
MSNPADCDHQARNEKPSALERILPIIKRLTIEVDLTATRFSLALAETFWAVSLFCTDNALSADHYAAMTQAMGQTSWAVVFTLTALAQWTILISGRYHGRVSAAFAGFDAFLWWYIIIGLFTSAGTLPAATGSELSLGCAAGWVLIRTGIKRRDIQWMALQKKGRDCERS